MSRFFVFFSVFSICLFLNVFAEDVIMVDDTIRNNKLEDASFFGDYFDASHYEQQDTYIYNGLAPLNNQGAPDDVFNYNDVYEDFNFEYRDP